MCEDEQLEVHCASFDRNGCDKYVLLPDVIIHRLPMKAKENKLPRWAVKFIFLVKVPFYPFNGFFKSYRIYRFLKNKLKKEMFDLVVCQCHPEVSLWSGVLLKKHGFIDKLMVLFWDNIYGNMPRRLIPFSFAIRRQRWAEGIVARYADCLVSLYPIRSFHEKYGEIPQALGKRSYLGIPSVIRPDKKAMSTNNDSIVKGKINILFSGTIFRDSYVEHLVNLLNSTSIVQDINLIFFQKGLSADKCVAIKKMFRGSIYISGWIPLPDLLSLYPHVDFFISCPGYPTAIRSKLFEYVSFGKPLLVLYEDDSDVNISVFSNYYACDCIDIRQDITLLAPALEKYLLDYRGKELPFEEIEQLFKLDTPTAYVNLIKNMLNNNVR